MNARHRHAEFWQEAVLASGPGGKQVHPKEDLGPPRAVHCAKEHYHYYIGMAGPLGNPFVIGRDGTREQVIAKYERWLHKQPDALQLLSELRGLTLGCLCDSHPCDGDIVLALANAPLEMRAPRWLPADFKMLRESLSAQNAIDEGVPDGWDVIPDWISRLTTAELFDALGLDHEADLFDRLLGDLQAMVDTRDLRGELRCTLQHLYPSIPTDEERISEDHHQDSEGRRCVLLHYPSPWHVCLDCRTGS